MEERATDYTLQELLVAASAREIEDGDVVFVGVGIPLLGVMVAKRTHAPRLIMAMESGGVGPQPRRVVLGIGDNACVEDSIYATSLWRIFSDQQAGYFDVGMIGGAQVDKYGNLNSTAIFGAHDYKSPASRLPGSGGANDVASSAGRTILTIPLQRRRFVERVDYITSPGYIDGPGAREALGLPGGGPEAIITDKCIFRFDAGTKEVLLDSVHPGVTVEEVRREVAWDLRVSPDLKVTEPPSAEVVRITRILDSERVYTGQGMKTLTFDNYVRMLEDSLAAFE